MKKKSIRIAAVAAVVLVPVALFLHTFSASPLLKTEPYAEPLPSATTPQDLAVLSVVTGVNHRVTAFVISRRLVVRAARLFHGRSPGEAPKG